MRITRSTLRRLISEESARLIAEAHEHHGRVVGAHHRHGPGASFVAPPEEEGDYYYGDADPFGDDEAIEKGYEYDPATAGYKKPPARPEDSIFDEVDVEYGDDGYDMTEGDDAPEGDDTMDGDDTLDETEDQHYNDDLQSRHGRFTTPENVKGTPQYKEKHAPTRAPAPAGSPYVSRRSERGDDDLFGGPPRVDEARWAQLAGILKS